jgi:NAD(P)-dependent dehydrogenase (short-subunit alcohol dehydrogenase family)
MFTVLLAGAVEGTSIKVNSAHPGWAKTEGGGGDTGNPTQMEAADAAKTAVDLALLPDAVQWPQALFIHQGKTMPW